MANVPGSRRAAGEFLLSRGAVVTGVPAQSCSQPLLILTGPPGAGKTTVAQALMAATTPAAHIVGDDFWGFIESGWVPPYLPGSEHQNRVVVAALGAAASEYSVGGYFVVLDALIGPWLLKAAAQVAFERGCDVHYVVLRPGQQTTMARAVARGGGALVDPAPVATMYDAFRRLGAFERYVVDSSHLSVAATVDAVVARVEAGQSRLDPSLLA